MILLFFFFLRVRTKVNVHFFSSGGEEGAWAWERIRFVLEDCSRGSVLEDTQTRKIIFFFYYKTYAIFERERIYDKFLRKIANTLWVIKECDDIATPVPSNYVGWPGLAVTVGLILEKGVILCTLSLILFRETKVSFCRCFWQYSITAENLMILFKDNKLLTFFNSV